MKPEVLFLIFILIGFILYCFLGNSKTFYSKIEGMNINENTVSTQYGSNPSYENYNHYNGTSGATKYYGPNGETAVINGISSITISNASGLSVEYVADNTSSNANVNIETIKFIGPNGGSATIFKGSNGRKALKITDTNGDSNIYSETQMSSTGNPSMTQSIDKLSPYYESYGSNRTTEYNLENNSASSINDSNYNYSNSLPKGIPQSQIIPGQEDLYILKSQVVPPVCPACNPVVIYKNKECSACPACARCPEPNFECKKVPNYNAVNNSYLPTPILNSFSGFGM